MLNNSMKQFAFGRSAVPGALALGVCLTGGSAYAQLTPGQIDSLKDFVGQRAELGVILGGGEAASGGSYTIEGRNGGQDIDYSLFKVGGRFPIGESRLIGDSGVEWNPVIIGVLGYMQGENQFTAG